MSGAIISLRSGGTAFLAGLLVLAATLAFAGYGVWTAAASWNAPASSRSPVATIDAITAAALVVPATTRSEAEAATLKRLLGVLQAEGVALDVGSFKASSDAKLVLLTFDIDGSPAAIWRAVHALEAGSPALVITRIRATARDQGAMLSISADALAAWAPADPGKPAVPVAASEAER